MKSSPLIILSSPQRSSVFYCFLSGWEKSELDSRSVLANTSQYVQINPMFELRDELGSLCDCGRKAAAMMSFPFVIPGDALAALANGIGVN